MNFDLTEALITAAKTVFLLVMLLQIVPVMLWIERRGSALMQNRLGPNRIGPLGFFHNIADVVKFIFKEDRPPGHVDRFYWTLAPLISLVPAFMTFSVIPFASSLDVNGRLIEFQAAKLDVGLLYIFAIASLGVYGIIMAGWSSNNKYALLGSIRSTAQMISYELSLGLSVIGLVMVFSTTDIGAMIHAQGETWFHLGPLAIPKWGIFLQPLGFVIFITALYAETNRLPFDLPEGESELVAGYHIEYGSMKFALFFMAEYLNMTTASGLLAALFFGGWQFLPGFGAILAALPLEGFDREVARVLLEFASFWIKVGFFLWLFVWVRWTIPRFRFDQLMAIGWKVMLPLSLLNLLVTGFLVYLGVM